LRGDAQNRAITRSGDVTEYRRGRTEGARMTLELINPEDLPTPSTYLIEVEAVAIINDR
jgi:hypothetical protein